MLFVFFFSSRRRHTRLVSDWSSDVCSSDLVVGPAEHERIVATSSYYVDPRDQVAEVAYMVEPGWQRTGLATALHARTVEYAKAHGVRGLAADVLTSNPAMLRVFRRGQELGLHGLGMDADAGVYELDM